MLLTITCNATIDRTLHVPHLRPGAVHRARGVHVAAGGKGINVARAAQRLGCRVTAGGPLVGNNGRWFAELARQEGIEGEWYWLGQGETRNCILINHDSGDATVINEPGPLIGPEDWEGFRRFILERTGRFQAVVFSGSVPAGISGERFAELALAAARSRDLVWVDTSGPALEAVLRHPKGLAVKVNRRELAAALGFSDEPDESRLLLAGRELLAAGARAVVITLGAQGALGISPQDAWRVDSPRVEVRSSVGSGDSFLGGLLAAALHQHDFPSALALASACGAANAATALPARFDPQHARALQSQVRIERRE